MQQIIVVLSPSLQILDGGDAYINIERRSCLYMVYIVFISQTSSFMINLFRIKTLAFIVDTFNNPYKPSVLFVGRRQTVETQTQNAASDQGRHCLLTESSIDN